MSPNKTVTGTEFLAQLKKLQLPSSTFIEKLENVNFDAVTNEVAKKVDAVIARLINTVHEEDRYACNAGIGAGLSLRFAKERKFYSLRSKKISFTVHCHEKYGIDASYGHRLAKIADQWLVIADHPVKPASADSLLPLSKLGTDADKLRAWESAAMAAGGNSPTAAEVKYAVSVLLGKPAAQRGPSKLVRLAREVLILVETAKLNEATARLREIIEEEKPVEIDIVVPPTQIPLDFAPSYPIFEEIGVLLVARIEKSDTQSPAILTEFGFEQTDPGEWTIKSSTYRESGCDAFVQKLRNAIAANAPKEEVLI